MIRPKTAIWILSVLALASVTALLAVEQSEAAPCSTVAAGCYDQSNNRAARGSLDLASFGHYYSERVCVTGGCQCSASQTTHTGRILDPDQNGGACECVAGADWDQSGSCCGDDGFDCTKQSDNFLCNIDAVYRDSRWEDPSALSADIVHVACANREYLSDGSTFFPCGNESFTQLVAGHEYLCTGANSSCQNQEWYPTRGQVEKGITFTQTSNCGATRETEGTLCALGKSMGSAMVKKVQKTGQTSHQPGLCQDAGHVIGTCTYCSDATGLATCEVKDSQRGLCGEESVLECPKGTSAEVVSSSGNEKLYSCVISGCTETSEDPPVPDQTLSAPEYVECCGTDQCHSSTDGRRLSSGEHVLVDGERHYCADDKTFTRDLDVKDETTCHRAGFTWTGTKCCGEPEDGEESYNDETGGCFKGEPVLSVSFANTTGNELVNYDGAFMGCRIGSENSSESQELLGLTDRYTQGQLITDTPSCTLDPTGSYFCDVLGEWKATDGSARSELKEAPVTASRQRGCCSANTCWDGEGCVEDQSKDPFGRPHLGGYRCVLGEWREGTPKLMRDGSYPDPPVYCPEPQQCLVNPLGDVEDNNDPSENPQCINDSQYIEDDLCFEGNWTSRTREVALKLLDVKQEGEDFILFCDKTQNTLNEVNFLTETSGRETGEVFGNDANNICVLKQNNTVIIGTTFNVGVDDQLLFDLFGLEEGCPKNVEDGRWGSCEDDGRIWYNPALSSLIFSDASLGEGEGSFFSLLLSQIRAPFTETTSTIGRTLGTPSFSVDNSYQTGLWKFQRLYISEQGDKRIFGVLEGETFQSAVLRYDGFSTDICEFTGAFSQQRGDQSSGIECRQEEDAYYVLLQGGQLTSFRPENAWTDLTSKLRIE